MTQPETYTSQDDLAKLIKSKLMRKCA